MEVRKDQLRFFSSSAEFRKWLEKNHADASEIWIGFYRKDSAKGGITYHEALDEALCFGWIDGIRKKLDDVSFTNRFTPRKPKSIWSNVNVQNNRAAWKYFESAPPYYRKLATGWVTGAKREETRERRLAELIDCSAHASRLPQFTPASRKR